MNSDDILQAQVAYYRARADEYDDWWERRGDFDLGEEFHAAWRADIDALDASPEVLNINRARLTEQGHAASFSFWISLYGSAHAI